MTETTSRILELDGLRGIAILMVLAFHIFPVAEQFSNQGFTAWISKLSSMGWAGVDVFFVLSGFLITSILIREKNHPHYFRNFYTRRVLRIMPVYYLLITILFVVNFLAGWIDIKTVLKSAAWFYTFTGNWLYAFNDVRGFYFEHLWSIAIEEQFYLVWPIIVLRYEPKKISKIGIATMLFALLTRVVLVFFSKDYGNTFPYYATISRLDGLMLGSMIATGFQTGLISQFPKNAAKFLIISLAIICTCIVYKPDALLWNNELMLTVGFSALALLAGALIIIAQTWNEAHFLRRFFRFPVLLFLGKYSYALYLFHWPVLFLIMNLFLKISSVGFIPWLVFSLACFFVTIGLSFISWNILEYPILELKRYFV